MFGRNSKKHRHHHRETFFLGEMEQHGHSQNAFAAEKEKTPAQQPTLKKHLRAKRDVDRPKTEKPLSPLPSTAKPKADTPKKPLRASRDLKKKEPLTKLANEENFLRAQGEFAKDMPGISEKEAKEGEMAVKNSLDGMFGVYQNAEKRPQKKMTRADVIRYAVLFVCIFGFLLTGYFVFRKLYDYYRSYVVYSGLQEMVVEVDRFAEDYMKKSPASVVSLTPIEAFDGKASSAEGGAFSEEQETLVRKISQLKKINPDTVGWISIDGTVVNYPVVRSDKKDYYLRRDFYGKVLSGGSIYVDNRNSAKLTENRNTVIYGHNMADGSMFASIHDFTSASVFYNVKIEITTEEGVFIYTPFSVHESHAYDNYFETDFVSDEDFVNFCEQVAFLSIYETNFLPNKDSRIITLSTCMDNESATEQRFAVHAYLTEVIR